MKSDLVGSNGGVGVCRRLVEIHDDGGVGNRGSVVGEICEEHSGQKWDEEMAPFETVRNFKRVL